MNFYRRFVGDWLRDTTSLSMMQDGAYSRLVDVHFATEKGLPLDKKMVYRMARAVSRSERRAVDFVLKKFFQRGPGGYTQKRVLEEINYATARISAARENGKRGGRPRQKQNPMGSSSKPSSNPTGLFTEPSGLSDGNPEPNLAKSYPDSRYQTPDALAGNRSLTRADSDTLFQKFWSDYPRKIRKRETHSAWRALSEPDRIAAIEALATFKASSQWREENGKFIPSPHRFLSDKRFENPPVEGKNNAAGSGTRKNHGVHSGRDTDYNASRVDLPEL
jgi:uncharacterized protein YdaU (DUF1376 family)